MKRLSMGCAVLLAMPFSQSIAQQLPEDLALREQVRKLDLAHAEAIFKGDKAALQELLPDDHTVNHPTNRIVQEKSELLRLIGDGVIRYIRADRTAGPRRQ